MPRSVERWRELMSPAHAPLREAAAAAPLGDVRAVERLRHGRDPDLVAAALALAEARRRAAIKLPSNADRLVADVEGVQMASSETAAAWKAGRIANAGGGRAVVDVCCGIGGDAMALGAAQLGVLGIDLDPTRAWMTTQNAGCETRPIDAAEAPVDGAILHVDPARRDPGGRRRPPTLDAMIPGPAIIGALIDRAAGAAVKLAPGVEPSDLRPGQSEFISESGRLTQAVLWTGALDEPEPVRATRLPRGDTIAGTRGVPPVRTDAGPCIFTMDPALERARLGWRLAERHGLAALVDPGTGLLTGERPKHEEPWIKAYLLHARLPWQPRRVRAELARLDAGLVVVKTRGGVVDPDVWQSRLRGRGEATITVFALRVGSRVEALIAREI